jgi:hypothetical protein
MQTADRETGARAAILERARAAREAARELRGRSEDLRLLLAMWRQGTPVSHCAWCRRYGVSGRWLETHSKLPFTPQGHMTNTICDDCSQALREAGMSA